MSIEPNIVGVPRQVVIEAITALRFSCQSNNFVSEVIDKLGSLLINSTDKQDSKQAANCRGETMEAPIESREVQSGPGTTAAQMMFGGDSIHFPGVPGDTESYARDFFDLPSGLRESVTAAHITISTAYRQLLGALGDEAMSHSDALACAAGKAALPVHERTNKQ